MCQAHRRCTRGRAAICVAALPLDRSATIVTKKARGTPATIVARVTNVARLGRRSGPAMIAARVMIATRGTSGARGRSMRPLAAT